MTMGAVVASLAVLVGAAAGGIAPPPTPIAWVEMTAAGAEARIITAARACPSLLADGRARAMRPRAGPNADFPERVCSAPIPKGARQIAVGGLRLPTPLASPRRLVILGDTGCRLKGIIAQSCNNVGGWPFARVAARAAAEHPDLVIHVGDYYYRESACPPWDGACAGSPHGDKAATWRADFFDPAAPLLAAAPWVFARGNHEDCARGGPGWFRLLDAAPVPASCPASSASFEVPITGARLIVVDSADTDDFKASAPRVAAFAASLAPLDAPARDPPPAWIVTHRPFWYARRDGRILSDGGVNATERAAARRRDLTAVALIVSGHVHNFSSLAWVAESRPAQLIVGAGGDLMAPNDAPPPVDGRAIVDGLAAQVLTMGRFGYLLLQWTNGEWRGAFKDADGHVAAFCTVRGRALSCRPV